MFFNSLCFPYLAQVTTEPVMSFDLTIDIVAIITLSSVLSSVIVAIINNFHNSRIRKWELNQEKQYKQAEIQQLSITKQFEVYYSDKRKSFYDLLTAAGNYGSDKQSLDTYAALVNSIHKALLFCNPDNQTKLKAFLSYVDNQAFAKGYSQTERTTYNEHLSRLALSLNAELEETKPVLPQLIK